MNPLSDGKSDDRYRACRSVLGNAAWDRLAALCAKALDEHSLSVVLLENHDNRFPEFLPELARLEEIASAVGGRKASLPQEHSRPLVNPTIQITQLSWKNLASFLDPDLNVFTVHPIRASERVLLWNNPFTDRVSARPVNDEDLLVLKMIVEGISTEDVAAQGGLPLGAVDAAMSRAAASGLILTPPSLIRRDPKLFPRDKGIPGQYLSSPSFTLQWHITQACDLHCKHCYDRSNRAQVQLDQAIGILDDLRTFCKSKYVAGGVSFTGGNPLLHPSFPEIYRAAVERGFSTAILGNPAPTERIAELIAIQMPSFYQVSLEGLQEHNDAIRGPGHFDRVLAFLEVLKGLNVYAMVMLTLTSMNIDQVLPLAEILRGKADIFHFNRLSMVGEGSQLRLPEARHYRSFLDAYLDAARMNPVMGIKDNLINIIQREQGVSPFGGCTGHGCGAAFNFVSLLPDGEVHACRKFPSLIGNIYRQSLAEIYDSDQARRYRSGSAACRSCNLRAVCGGCLASAHSHNRDVFKDKDPFCFMSDAEHEDVKRRASSNTIG
ncbi:MAG TPA: thio(seleno)oxazole modification radical SAM maturase SbtM [Nitrospirota bacterium]|nr:thio(seleno)oxazole modification radical SAM maturase SbtM [Nitrospirota bacterium]